MVKDYGQESEALNVLLDVRSTFTLCHAKLTRSPTAPRQPRLSLAYLLQRNPLCSPSFDGPDADANDAVTLQRGKRADGLCKDGRRPGVYGASQFVSVLVRQRRRGGVLELLLVLGHEGGVDLDLWGRERRRRDEFERRRPAVGM